MTDLGRRRAQELLKLLEHLNTSAGQVIERSDGTGPMKRQLREALGTANYVMRGALDNIERWAKRDE